MTGNAAVQTDPRRLERVLSNLVANAIEHGGGSVEVHIEARDEGILGPAPRGKAGELH